MPVQSESKSADDTSITAYRSAAIEVLGQEIDGASGAVARLPKHRVPVLINAEPATAAAKDGKRV